MEATSNIRSRWVKKTKGDGGGKKRNRKKVWMEIHIPDKEGARNYQISGKDHQVYHGIRVVVSSVEEGKRVYATALARIEKHG